MNWWVISVVNTIFFSPSSCFPSCKYYLNRRKEGVFHYDHHTRYQLTYHEAEATCQRDFGATLATREQLMAALHSGLEECRAGWIASTEVAYPRIHKHWNCGENKTGIISYGRRQNLQERWDAFCYKEDEDCVHYERAYIGISLTKPGAPADSILKEITESQPGQQTQSESDISVITENILSIGSPTQSSSSLSLSMYGNPPVEKLTSTDFPSYLPTRNIEENIDSKEDNRDSSENQLLDTSESDSPEAATRQVTLSSRADIRIHQIMSKLYKNCQTDGCMKTEKLQSPSTAEPMHTMSEISMYTSNKVDPFNDSKISDRLPTRSSELYTTLSPSTATSKDNVNVLEEAPFFPTNEYKPSIIATSYSLQLLINTNLTEPIFTTEENIAQTLGGDMANEGTYVTTLLLNSATLSGGSTIFSENVVSSDAIVTSSVFFENLKITKDVPLGETNNKTLNTMDYSDFSSQLKDNQSVSMSTVTRFVSKSDVLTQTNRSPSHPSTVSTLGDTNKGSDRIPGAPTNDGNGHIPFNPTHMSFTTASADSPSTNTMISNFKNKTDFENCTIHKNQQLDVKGTQELIDDNNKTNSSPSSTAAQHISPVSNTVLLNPPCKNDIEATSVSTPGSVSGGQWKPTHVTMDIVTPAYGQYVTTLNLDTTASSVITESMQLTEDGTLSFISNHIKSLDTCGGFLHGQNGRFQSPGFPQSYTSNMNCTWVIEAPLGYYVTLDFISLVLEEHKHCLYDHVLVLDGKESQSKLLGRFCGIQIPQQIRSTSNVMTVVIRSDSSVELDGILAQYSTTQYAHAGVRLKGGQNSLEGEVEVEYNGISGSICAKQWTNKDAQVLCRQLGYSGPAVATRIIGEKNAAVAISFIICNGDEDTLDNCSLKNMGFCGTKERAGVVCQVFESCAALKDAGLQESGTYTIDPDGVEQGEEHFTVECDMESDSTTGITVIGHDSENRERVSPCEAPGCYSRILTYNGLSMDQLRALASVSESCEQFVRLDCRNIRFLNGPWGWWVSSDGRQITSWGGAITNSGRCACGEHGNCALELSSCNCDASDDIWRMDEGALTDKSTLPIREVRFGHTRNVPMQMAFHSIGKFQCWGTISEPPILKSCAALKKAGISDSGRYFIDPDGINQGVAQFEVYCDMSSDAGITVISHDSERRTRVAPCKEAGCYKMELKYTADFAQLNALTKISESCEQFVRLDCRHLLFLQSEWGWWVSWDGKKMLYWGGANSAIGGCACGKSGTCSTPDKICNCDSNDHIWRTDDGFLSDKEALPVQAVHFGDTDDFPLEMAYHTIGKLRCRG